jgi:hypothetical protein
MCLSGNKVVNAFLGKLTTPTGVTESPLFNMEPTLTLPGTYQCIKPGVGVRGVSDYRISACNNLFVSPCILEKD